MPNSGNFSPAFLGSLTPATTVVSYSVGADRLYYSAVRGTSGENGVVSTVTNEYNPLEITKKLSAIYTF